MKLFLVGDEDSCGLAVKIVLSFFPALRKKIAKSFAEILVKKIII
jgi:hypothetical protein